MPPSKKKKNKINTQKYEPIWEGQDAPWTGQTHKEAIHFCSAEVDVVCEPMTLCP